MSEPCKKAIEVAARVWCDQEMSSVVMDKNAAMEIAKIIDGVLADQGKRPSESFDCQTPIAYCPFCGEASMYRETGKYICNRPACSAAIKEWKERDHAWIGPRVEGVIAMKNQFMRETGYEVKHAFCGKNVTLPCTCPAADMLAEGWKCTCGAISR